MSTPAHSTGSALFRLLNLPAELILKVNNQVVQNDPRGAVAPSQTYSLFREEMPKTVNAQIIALTTDSGEPINEFVNNHMMAQNLAAWYHEVGGSLESISPASYTIELTEGELWARTALVRAAKREDQNAHHAEHFNVFRSAAMESRMDRAIADFVRPDR